MYKANTTRQKLQLLKDRFENYRQYKTVEKMLQLCDEVVVWMDDACFFPVSIV